MKRLSTRLLWPVLACVALSPLAAESPDLKDLLRDALYKEEVNRDPEAAAKAYQSVLARNDEERAFAATAQFRLAEVYRKQGRTVEAIAAYRLLLTRYPEAGMECKLARENLTTLGGDPQPPPSADASTTKAPEATDDSYLAALQIAARDRPDELAQDFDNATSNGFVKSLEFLLDHATPPPEENLLSSAQTSGSLAMVEMLIRRGVDLKDPLNRWAAVGAANQDQLYILKALLKAGMDINASAPEARSSGDQAEISSWPGAPATPLTAAIIQKGSRMIDFILEQKADVNAPSLPSRVTPLHCAVHSGDLALVQRLLTLGADANAVTRPLKEFGRSFFSYNYAPDAESAQIIKKELELSPLDIALCTGDPAMVALLEKSGAKPHEPLILAHALASNTDGGKRIHLMLEHGVDASFLKSAGDFYGIDFDKDLELTLLLAEHGAKFSNKQFGQILYLGSAEQVAIVLDHKSYAENALQHDDVLRLAQRPEIVSLVVARGAKATPDMVRYAVVSGDENRLRLLLQHGGDPNLIGDGQIAHNGKPLILCVKPPMAKILAEGGANLNARIGAESLLVNTLKDFNPDLARVLIEGGADLSDPSLLTLASRADTGLPLVQLLIRKGARPDANWIKQGFADAVPNGTYFPGSRSLLFSTFFLPQMEESQDIRCVTQITKLEVSTLEERSPWPQPRPLAELLTKFLKPYASPGYPYPPPGAVVIWRKMKEGGYTKIDVKVDDPAPYPALEWGDIIDTTDVDHAGRRAQDMRANVNKHISFPFSVEIDGEVREFKMEGKLLCFDAAQPEVPLMSATEVCELLANLKPDRLSNGDFTVVRKDWPALAISRNAGYDFSLTEGDRLVWKTEPVAAKTLERVLVTSPGLPFLLTFQGQSGSAPYASGAPVPATIPSLLQAISRTADTSGDGVLSYPDYSRIRIRRPQAGGAEKIVDVDLQARMDALPADFTAEQARQIDMQLEPGDVVELPVQANHLDVPWTGFTPLQQRVLEKALSRTIQVTNWQKQVVVRNLEFHPMQFIPGPNGIQREKPATGTADASLGGVLPNSMITAMSADGSTAVTALGNSIFPAEGNTYTESQPPSPSPPSPPPPNQPRTSGPRIVPRPAPPSR